MKLQIIGSGAIFTKNASASALIDDKILIDCGTGTFKQLLRLNCKIDEIDTILITHLHSDHFMDVPFMMLAASRNHKSGRKLTIFLPEGGIKSTHEIAKYLWGPEGTTETWRQQNIELIEYRNGEVLAVDEFKVKPVKVMHGELKASGFILDKNGKKVGFSGDSTLCDGVEEIVRIADWAVLDTSCPKAGNTTHMGADDIYRLCNEYSNKTIVATHMYDDVRRTIRQDVPNLIIPNDGEIFEL